MQKFLAKKNTGDTEHECHFIERNRIISTKMTKIRKYCFSSFQLETFGFSYSPLSGLKAYLAVEGNKLVVICASLTYPISSTCRDLFLSIYRQ
mmetsp:Transcript_3945/g.5907  ORF Transcript_3945/g.5907 Transcript_3945/m.5907 type:complete len:93 (-) Transcript_3945:262-540(-)